MTVDEILSAVASVLPKEEAAGFVATLKSEDGEWTEDGASRLKEALTTHIRTVSTNQHKRGIKEGSRPFENRIAAIASELGVDEGEGEGDILTGIVDHLKTLAKPAEVFDPAADPEKLLVHPAIRAVLGERIETATKDLRGQIQQLQTEHVQEKTAWQMQGVRSEIRGLIDNMVQKLNVPVKVEGIDVERRMRVFYNDPLFSPDKWRKDEKGGFVALDEKGDVRYHDVTGQAIRFEDVFDAVNPYGYDAHDSSKQSPPKEGDKAAGPVAKWRFGGDVAKFTQARDRAKTPQERAEISAAWLAEQNA